MINIFNISYLIVDNFILNFCFYLKIIQNLNNFNYFLIGFDNLSVFGFYI